MDYVGLLIWCTIVASLLGVGGLSLTTSRAYYLIGLVSAWLTITSQFVALRYLGSAISRALESADHSIVNVSLLVRGAFSPMIEEPIRVTLLLVFLAPTRDRGNWLAFALGYALLEFGLKFTDGVVRAQAGDLAQVVVLLPAPLVPLALHMFLGVLAMRLYAMGVHGLGILAALLVVHTAHNTSVFDWQVRIAANDLNPAATLPEIWLRFGIFLLLTILVLAWPRRNVAPRVPSSGEVSRRKQA